MLAIGEHRLLETTHTLIPLKNGNTVNEVVWECQKCGCTFSKKLYDSNQNEMISIIGELPCSE